MSHVVKTTLARARRTCLRRGRDQPGRGVVERLVLAKKGTVFAAHKNKRPCSCEDVTGGFLGDALTAFA